MSNCRESEVIANISPEAIKKKTKDLKDGLKNDITLHLPQELPLPLVLFPVNM